MSWGPKTLIPSLPVYNMSIRGSGYSLQSPFKIMIVPQDVTNEFLDVIRFFKEDDLMNAVR